MTSILMLMLMYRAAEGVRVIGGDRTAIQGQNVSLSCILTETKQTISLISWQKTTRRTPPNVNFYTIHQSQDTGPVNGYGDRFTFIGNLNQNDGSLQLSNVTLMDDGLYSCIFTLFPSGNHDTKMTLTVLVPPVTTLKDDHPFLGEEEDTLATCTAAGAKPAAEVTWHTGALAKAVRTITNSTQHADGTTTTVSTLVGVPNMEVNHRLVQCVVNHAALPKEETLPFTLQVYFSPTSVSITETSKETFQCTADANPNASFSWSRADQPWPQSAVRAEEGQLQFPSLTSDLNGLYVCEASNLYGQKQGYLYVHVSSGACTSCWIFIVFVSLIAVGTGFAIWHREKTTQYAQCAQCARREEVPHPSHSQVPTEESPGPNQGEAENVADIQVMEVMET